MRAAREMSRAIATARVRTFATHWLPSSARAWLENVENAAFTRALTDAMKKVPQLSGREEMIASSIAKRGTEIFSDAYRDASPSDAEATHAKTAARTIAAYEQLRPFLGNDDSTMDFLRTHAGAERTAVTMNGGLVKGALLLSRDRVQTLAGMVGNVTHDLRPGAWSRTNEDDGSVSFTTCECTYYAFFKKHDAAFLTQTTCCSLDVPVWFGNVDPKTATVELGESLARGDPRCRITVRPGA